MKELLKNNIVFLKFKIYNNVYILGGKLIEEKKYYWYYGFIAFVFYWIYYKC